MTAAELSCAVLERRNIPIKDKDYWSCWEISDKEEMGETTCQDGGENPAVRLDSENEHESHPGLKLNKKQ